MIATTEHFDRAIRRIVRALGIGEACGGVDTDDNGGHTAEVIERHILALRMRAEGTTIEVSPGLPANNIEFIHALEAELDRIMVSFGFARTGSTKETERVSFCYRQFGVCLPPNGVFSGTPSGGSAGKHG